MFIFALISGLLSLSSQVLFQKIVSTISGDVYFVFASVSLTFIFGMALGGFLSPKLRRFLPQLELIAGLYSLGIFFFNDALSALNPPLIAVLIGLIIPAFIFGTHLPLYSYYFRKNSFSWIYSFYHWGPIAGLLAVEYWLINAGSVRTLLLAMSVTQIFLSLLLFIYARQNGFHLQKLDSPLPNLKKILTTPSTLPIFTISALSFFQIAWAFRSQLMVTEAFRLQSTVVTVAVLFWMATAGLTSRALNNLPKSAYFFGWALLLLLIEMGLDHIPLFITAQLNGEVNNYIIHSLALALFFTSPVLFSSLFFIRETQSLKDHSGHEIDSAVGILNLIASVGNIFGYLLSAYFASMMWRPSYFGLALMAALLAYILTALHDNSNRVFRWSGVAILIGLAMLAVKRDQASILLKNRVSASIRDKIELHLEEIHTSAFSSLALVSFRQEGYEHPLQNLFYLLDGHLSHDLKRQAEVSVGLLPAKYFDRPIENSLVIGVGAGQSAWAVTAISQFTDLVEISPAAFSGLSLLAEYNNNLKQTEHIQFILQDGLRFVKKCEKQYDLILNTSTYPGNFNASKLYSEEFIAEAKACLTPDGVYENYFDGASVQDIRQLRDFLAPLKKHFKYVDILTDPYPVIFAYDVDRKLQMVTTEKIIRPADKKYFENISDSMNVDKCIQAYRHIPDMGLAQISTLDRSVIESHSIHNMIKENTPGFQEKELTTILPSDWSPTCE